VLAAGKGAALCGLSAAVYWKARRRKVPERRQPRDRDRRPWPRPPAHPTRGRGARRRAPKRGLRGHADSRV